MTVFVLTWRDEQSNRLHKQSLLCSYSVMVAKLNTARSIVCGFMGDGCCDNKIQAIIAIQFVSRI
jgi:hypothetical protein